MVENEILKEKTETSQHAAYLRAKDVGLEWFLVPEVPLHLAEGPLDLSQPGAPTLALEPVRLAGKGDEDRRLSGRDARG